MRPDGTIESDCKRSGFVYNQKDFSRLNFYRKPHFWANTSVMPAIEVSQWLKNTLQIRKIPQDRLPCLSTPVIDVVRAHWPWDKFHQVHLFCAHGAPMWRVVALATDSIQIRVTFTALFISNSLQIITIIFKCVPPVNYCNFSVSIFIILKSLAL